MHRLSWLALSFTLLGCSSSPPNEHPPLLDAGVTLPPDAGTPVQTYGTLGAEVLTNGDVRFRLFSSRATRVALLLFAKAQNEDAVWELLLRREETEPDVWTVQVTKAELEAKGLALPLHYGYRVWGPNWPFDASWTPGSGVGFVADVDEAGNRFNPNKLLLDPYAKEVSHDPTHEGFRDGSIYLSGPAHRNKDSAKQGPKGIVLIPTPEAFVGPRPERALKDDIVYEVHLRGFTRADSSLPEDCRGTYKAAGEKAKYLKALGVTAVEFLPVQETWNDTNDVSPGTSGDNYWGYSTLAFFAPDRRYACDRSPGGPTREFQAMTRAFHTEGIKVFIDVVYNHTGEGGTDGSGDQAGLRSFRGLDNAAYYQVKPDGRGYRNDNGVSPNMNVTHEVTRALTLDSLQYWSRELGVDGFRFDLAAILGNGCKGDCFRFEPNDERGILQRVVKELPARPDTGGAGVDILSEPWGVTEGTYQLGRFPRGWSDWNGVFRDTLRRDLNRLGVEGVTPRTLLSRLTGSTDLMGGRRPVASLNYVVSHDGFTLRDLFSCNVKVNDQPWPFGPSDGGENNNLSWNQEEDPALQRQAARNALTLLTLSAGVPMITGGDEMLRTQYCNNNPYNLDSDKNWLDWTLQSTNATFLTFTQRLFAFRHAHPAFRPLEKYREGDGNGNGYKPLTVMTAAGTEADGAYLDNDQNHFLALRYDGGELEDPSPWLYVAYNGSAEKVTATLPPVSPGKQWLRVADTAAWNEPSSNFAQAGAEAPINGTTYELHPRSVLILIER